MPTLIELPDIGDCAVLCGSLGLRFIELNMNLPQYQAERIDIERFRRTADEYGIYYTIHLDENLNPADFNRRVAMAYLDTVVETIDTAKKLNAPVLNMHLARGVYFTLPDKRVYLFAENKALYLRSMLEFRERAAEAFGGSGIKLCVENSDGYTDFQLEALELLLESPAFALTFDIGHDHGIGGIDEPVIMRHADRLCHMHLHDALGEKNHLPLGEGEIELEKYLSLAERHNCRAVLETKTIDGLKKSVDWIIRRKSAGKENMKCLY